MLLRRFNQAGIDRFRAFIATLNVDASPSTKSLRAPVEILEDDKLTEVIKPHTECPDATFANRLAAAEYLNTLLAPTGLVEAYGDIGLWSWLALRFFDKLRPLKNGVVLHDDMGVQESRFVPSDILVDRNLRAKRHHRHLLRHPLEVYRMAGCNADRAMCFLVQPVYRPGDFIEQIATRRMYTWYDEMLATLSALVVDPESLKIKDNASSKARRLDEVLQQFDCTWDLGFIAKDLLVPMLPDEFEQFRSAKQPKQVSVRRRK